MAAIPPRFHVRRMPDSSDRPATDRDVQDLEQWGPVLLARRMTPNRSLTAHGRNIVILLLTGASLAIGTLFWILGAWPVPGFCGLEVAAACVLLRRNARDLRRIESIELRQWSLLLSRTDTNGRTIERRLSPYWLRVDLLDRPGAIVRVRLAGHGVQEEVGRLLGESERRILAHDLRLALHSCRNPNYGWLDQKPL